MNKNWIAAWGCPIAQPPRNIAEWVKDTTVRMNLFMTVSGSAVRLHFSNLFGQNAATITRATVAACRGGSDIDTARLAEVTFGGSTSGTMAPHGAITSDEIPFEFKAGESITVNLYFGDFVKLDTAHCNSGDFIEKWVAGGDYTRSATLDINGLNVADSYPFIHTVDALCSDDCYSIVAFGDSITSQSWPDRLARRVNELGITNVAVVRKAISGSRVLREYPCVSYRTYGPRGDARFEREVLQAGVKKVFILHGINDIIHPGELGNPFRPISDLPTADELIDGLMYYINTAHRHGIEVYLSPILPFCGWRTYTDEKEIVRLTVNRWIREEAPVEGIIDFEAAVWNPRDPLFMLPQFDSGDHLHPSGDGAQAMADCISEQLL